MERPENKTYKCTIWGRFPSLNEYIDASRIHKAKANNMKKEAEDRIILGLYTWLKGVQFDKPIQINYTFYEANKKRDLDNVSGFFHKVFQDALVRAGFIKNDNWNYIVGFSDKFFVDKAVPRVDIEIVEVDE